MKISNEERPASWRTQISLRKRTFPVVLADRVQRLSLDNFKFTRVPGVTEPLVTTNVGKVTVRDSELGSALTK